MAELDPYYGKAIWTKHALQRLKERNLDQSVVWYAFKHPDSSSYGSTKRSYKYHKIIGNRFS